MAKKKPSNSNKARPAKAPPAVKDRAVDALPIIVRGAREHNLRNVQLELPRNKFVCFTGVSGSGKSSLAFDTLFAEGQRRYLESLSTYARQFVGQMPKPDVDLLSGLAPAISISQKSTGYNPRSTVGTVTELTDFLRVLFARCGTPFCPKCKIQITQQTPEQMIEKINALPTNQSYAILSPVIRGQRGAHKDLFQQLQRLGFNRIRADGTIYSLANPPELERFYSHNIDVVIDRILRTPSNKKSKKATGNPLPSGLTQDQLAEAVRKGLLVGQGVLILSRMIPLDSPEGDMSTDWGSDPEQDIYYSQEYACSQCGTSFPPPSPQLLSFNSPQGACPDCDGLGEAFTFTEELLVPNTALSVTQGAIAPLGPLSRNPAWLGRAIRDYAESIALHLNTRDELLDKPWITIPKEVRSHLLNGQGRFSAHVIRPNYPLRSFYGIAVELTENYRNPKTAKQKASLEKYMTFSRCHGCYGERLNPQARSLKLHSLSKSFPGEEGWKSISQCSALQIDQAVEFFSELELTSTQTIIAAEALKEIRNRLQFLQNVGLGYLSLARTAPSLSGGESQRIRLASQIGAGLTGVLYVLDEPSIGLHPRDNEKLLRSLQHLRDLGNTLIVVEHDEDTMRAADILVDFGPGPGVRGGELLAVGSIDAISKHPKSLTGGFLARRRSVDRPVKRRTGNGKTLRILGAQHNNLKNINVDIPLGRFIAITGVSGSGKSSLVTDILSPALRKVLNRSEDIPGAHQKIKGIEYLDKMIDIDQSPIGRTPRSNPATYTKLFDEIRDLFAELPESKRRGFEPGTFSFNTELGRCSACEGHGALRLDMEFLADLWVPCALCEGKRYSRATLQVLFKDKSIADCLDLDVQQAIEHFEAFPKILSKLKTLSDVGLEYLKLGQPSPTLSGGEAQRIKLSRELSKRSTGQTMFVLDEPTTGLHFHDIDLLLKVLQNLVDRGNTVVVVEHNLDLIQAADWIIDLGPEGGEAGGRVVCQGTPEQVAEDPTSHTGRALKNYFEQHRSTEVAASKKPSTTSKKTKATPQILTSKSSQESSSQSYQSIQSSPALQDIRVIGAQQHNLKKLDAVIPKNSMTVLCGHSGSGKTSLALDTIYAEGQRRFVESLSPYVRQFVGQMPKPPVERIEGLAPAIAIEQRALSHTPRSTVGTVTEIYDYLRLLFARLGQMHCTKCDSPVETQTIDQILDRWMQLRDSSVANRKLPQRCLILAPAVPHAKQTLERFFEDLRSEGYTRVRINGETREIDAVVDKLPKTIRELQVVVDRIQFDQADRKRLSDTATTALNLGQGIVQIALVDETLPEKRWKTHTYSLQSACHECGLSFYPLTPHQFSFNTSVGWCPACEGLGIEKGTDPAAFIDELLSPLDGGLLLWPSDSGPVSRAMLMAMGRYCDLPVDRPLREWSDAQQHTLFQGIPGTLIPVLKKDLNPQVENSSEVAFHFEFKGFFPTIDMMSRMQPSRRYLFESFLGEVPCRACKGGRVREEASHVRLLGRKMAEIVQQPIGELVEWVESIAMSKHQMKIGGELLREVAYRLRFLVDIGLDYITLGRTARTLSGGEAQRIRLASQLGTGLCGVLYVLDEPTIGLHPRDNAKLIRAMHHLRDQGNTLLVVEHDRDVIASSDSIRDFGPGAGPHGGRIIAQGTPEEIRRDQVSVTGPYLSGAKRIELPRRRKPIIDPATKQPRDGIQWLTIHRASHNNLRYIDASFPIGHLIAVTGPSGSGKSSLINGILFPALSKLYHRTYPDPGYHRSISGTGLLNKVMQVDQSPLGATPSSTPATYSGVFELIRELFAKRCNDIYVPASSFSFNVGDGRCSQCEGVGKICIKMHFLPDVWIECDSCHGKRYKPKILEFKYKGKSIHDVLEMTTAEALHLFKDEPRIAKMLDVMCRVGLDYVSLGQSAPSLSGGEAQRVKLATELCRPSTGKTLFLLDEPTTGLHFDDINKLMLVLDGLVNQGNTVVVIEHNLEVIRVADWVIDLGPEAGRRGGEIVFAGTPDDMIAYSKQKRPDTKLRSYTGEALAEWEASINKPKNAKG